MLTNVSADAKSFTRNVVPGVILHLCIKLRKDQLKGDVLQGLIKFL